MTRQLQIGNKFCFQKKRVKTKRWQLSFPWGIREQPQYKTTTPQANNTRNIRRKKCPTHKEPQTWTNQRQIPNSENGEKSWQNYNHSVDRLGLHNGKLISSMLGSHKHHSKCNTQLLSALKYSPWNRVICRRIPRIQYPNADISAHISPHSPPSNTHICWHTHNHDCTQICHEIIALQQSHQMGTKNKYSI